MEILVVILIGFLIATPIVAILAYTRVQELTAKLGSTGMQDSAMRLSSLEQRLSALEKKLADLTGSTPPAPPAVTPLQAIPSPQPRTSPPPSSPPLNPSPSTRLAAIPAGQTQAEPPRDASIPTFNLPALPKNKAAAPDELENRIGGHWLNRIGILAVFIGVSFFLKFAFDNNWVGPSGRVAIGILIGALMLPWSQWLLGRGYPYFSEGIAALGQSILLLSLWAGCRYYTVFGREVGLVGMILVTVTIGAVALGRNSQRVAMLSILGGFLTPILLSAGKDEEIALFTYVFMLSAAALILAWKRDWSWLTPVSFILTQCYFWGWYVTFYQPAKLEPTLVFATLFFILYSTAPMLYSIRSGSPGPLGTLLVLVNAFNYFSAAYAVLWPQHRWPLTLLVLALSAAHLAVSRFLPPPKPGDSAASRLLFGGLALTFATLAIPVRLDGKWITFGFAIEGALLIWTGFRSLNLRLRQAGYFLLALAAARLLLFPIPAPDFLLNARFAAYLVLIGSIVASLLASREHATTLGTQEKSVLGVLAVAANAFAVLALSLEFWDYFGRSTLLGVDAHLAQHLALSLIWTLYAAILILAGVKLHSVLLRWQALVLFGLAVVKVFVYDSSYLDRFYRIVSFLILGVLLLVVSFLYQKKISRERSIP